MKFPNYELILSSGSIKACIFLGGLQELNKYIPLYNFRYLTGCSAGSIILTLYNIGYTLNELKYFLIHIDIDHFQEFKIKNFFTNCGFDTGNKTENLLKACFMNKNIDINITFEELYIKSKVTLTLTIVNLTKGISEYCNHLNTPKMSVLLALRMSMNIPIIYEPIKYQGQLYVDGALLDPFPVQYIKDTEKIGMVIYDKNEYQFIQNLDATFIHNNDNTVQYIFNLMKIIYANYLKDKYKKKYKNVIYYDTEAYTISFKLEKQFKEVLVEEGEKKIKKHFKKIYNKKRKIMLASKYYACWKAKIEKIKRMNSLY